MFLKSQILATENKYRYSKAYFKILDLIKSNPKEDIFIVRGGQGASKTISLLQLIIQALLNSQKDASIVSSELSKMKRTSIRDYRKICKDWGLISDSSPFNKSESKHEYYNDSLVEFLGADVSDIGKGYRTDILYINEADKLDLDTASQFISRAGLTIIDYNPDSLFWGDDYINENNCLTLTFEDNEFCPESEVRSILEYKVKGFHNPDLEDLFNESNIKSYYWSNKWRVYGLGLVGKIDGVVFADFKVIDSLPNDARYLGTGLDFGYTNDPTAAVDLYKYNDGYILDECLYQKGLSNSAIYSFLKNKSLVIADSAEPKSIAELQNYGLRVFPAVKGQGSVSFGIQTLHENIIYVTRRSFNLLREVDKYSYAKDRMGNTTNKPIDAFNHLMDASRYIAGETMVKQAEHYGSW